MEYEIDLKKYFKSLIRYWWVCIIMAAVFGTALGGYKYVKDTKDKTKVETNAEPKNMDDISALELRVAEAKAKFSVDELQNVEIAVEYYKQLQQYNRYLESSIYASQDPYHVNKTTLYYVIEIDSSINKDFAEKQVLSDNIATAYMYYVNSGAFIDKLSNQAGVASQYMSEIIQGVKVDNNILQANYFRVTFINDSDLGDISEYVDEFINEYTSDLSTSLGKHSLKLVDAYTATVFDEDIMNNIQSTQTNIYNASTRLTSIKKNFTANQKSCYNDELLIVNFLDAQENSVEEDKETKEDEDDIVVTPENVKVNKKYIFLGAIIGIVFYCGMVLLLQIFSPYIVSESGFQGIFGLRYLGTMSEESFGLIAMKIKQACKADEVGNVALVGSDSNIISSEVIDNLIKQLGKDNIVAVKLDSILSDEEDMSELFNIGKCILIERTGRSKIKNVAALVDLCKENAIKTYGVIDVKS